MINNFSSLIFYLCILLLFKFCACENVIKNDDVREDDGNDDTKEETLEISDVEASNTTTCTRRKNNQMHEIKKANLNQFPFVVAIMSSSNEYLCAGSIIGNGLILTTAQCADSASHVLINTTNDKTNENSLHITKTDKFPTATSTNVIKNIAILYTEKFNNTMASKINLSNYTSINKLNDIQALGFGLNAEVGLKKELQYVGLEARLLVDDMISAYLDCIDTKVPTCFKDKGGPVIFNNELIGIVVGGQNECTLEMTSTYALNKQMITATPTYIFKAWLDEKILNNLEQGKDLLEAFPKKPVLRKATAHAMTSAGTSKDSYHVYILMPLCFCKHFL